MEKILFYTYFFITNSFTWNLLSNILTIIATVAIILFVFHKILIIFLNIYTKKKSKDINEHYDKYGQKVGVVVDPDVKDYYRGFKKSMCEDFNISKDKNILLYKSSILYYDRNVEVYFWNISLSHLTLFNTNIKMLLLVKYFDLSNNEIDEIDFIEVSLSDFSFNEKIKLLLKITIFKNIEYVLKSGKKTYKTGNYINSKILDKLNSKYEI